ncbi:TMV resistance protein N [Glycine soja]
MACSSSHTKNFDVFVSFRGLDTRNSFTDHLFAALQRKGIVAFRDNQNINKGELLEPELLQAIEGSHVFIVVFSKDYASSTWCLKELRKIFDGVEETGRSVLPIFYDVTPSEVRKQSGKFGKAFAEHEERFKDDLEMVKKWREALKAIGNRSGWDVQNKSEHEEIEKIVEEVMNLLGHNQIWSFSGDLVDMNSRVKQLEELLDLSANDVVRVVGIWGMSGVGKTTLVTALFGKISPQYDAHCFIDDLNKNCGDFGATSAQKQLLCQALNQGNMEIHNLSHGTMLIRTRLRRLKTLIVLDNVDQVEQLENLALHREHLGEGSRIIIISKNMHILRNYGVDEVYNVQLLNKDKALQLLCKKAFKSDDIVKGYEEVTSDVLKYVNGLPLAIKVLGSFLFDRDVIEWRSALTRMKENPRKDIMDVLRISFDGLETMEKEIFLDIACFLSSVKFWLYSHYATPEKILGYRGFYSKIGMKVLVEKSLISYHKGNIQMHDLLKELGKTIVREKAPKEPRKWSRLWDYKDLQKVMIENKEAKNLEAIVIGIGKYQEEFSRQTMKVDALSKMIHLKLLVLKNVKFSGILNSLSNELTYLNWNNYPFTSLPSSFHPDQLVELILPYSIIKELWKDTKYLPNLEILDLKYSKNLIEMPDLSGVPHLRDLDLEGCTKIVRIDPSIGTLRELVSLNLRNCKNLFLNLNIIFGLSSLVDLNLSGCSKLLNNRLLQKPRETEHMEKIDENRSSIQLSTSSVYEMLMLPFYIFSSWKHEDSLGLLVPYLSRFPRLFVLDLSFCNLLQIPDAIGNLHSLEELNLGGNKFMTLPNTIKQLSKLQSLNLEHCKQLKYLPELPTPKKRKNRKHVGELITFNCPNLSEMELIYGMVFSWTTQIFEVHWQSSLSFKRLIIVIPGTEIPRWFSKQNEGDSISMDPSPVMEDPNWIGVACCALLVAHHDPSNIGNRWTDHFESIGYSFQNKQVLNITSQLLPIHLQNDLVTGELDHLLILFASREEFLLFPSEHKTDMHGLDTRGFTTSIYDHPKGLRMQVKSCGYRWVFKEDLQQLNPNMMFRGNPSSRKRKLLSIPEPTISRAWMNSNIQSKVTVHLELNGHYGKTNSMDFYLVLTLELTAFPFLTELSPPVRLQSVEASPWDDSIGNVQE